MKELYVVGIGPGEERQMTLRAREVLEGCQVIAGYSVYVELIRSLYPQKEYIVTAMRQEEKRCLMALEAAASGKTTAMVCSGDSGVYGMAGLLLTLGEAFPQVDIHVVAGVTAALSGGAMLGAPLGHDFSVISLSDLLTPWEVIEKRLTAAAMGDFVICLYNPASHRRRDYLQRACDILLRQISPDTVCGYVKNIGREGCEAKVLSLRKLRGVEADMFTTVFIGSSQTRKIGSRMVTPRGYHSEK